MFIPEWFAILVVIFIVVLLVRLAQLHMHVEELQDCVAKLEEEPEKEGDSENEPELDSGGD